jgi:hypothetical protein
MKRTIIFLALLLAGCGHTPERYEIYQSLINPKVRLEVLYIGRNWEIKDAVNAHKISDSPWFHSKMFWDTPNDEQLVVFNIRSQGPVYMQIDEFLKQFKRVSN